MEAKSAVHWLDPKRTGSSIRVFCDMINGGRVISIIWSPLIRIGHMHGPREAKVYITLHVPFNFKESNVRLEHS